MKTWSIAALGVIATFFAGAGTASADPRPPELGVGGIQLVSYRLPTGGLFFRTRTVEYVRVEIYCGGLFGGSYPAGRTATVEVIQAGQPTRVIQQRTLPEISSKTGYFFYVPVPGGHFARTATVRVRLSGGDANPSNDVGQRTFFHLNINSSLVLRESAGLRLSKLPR